MATSIQISEDLQLERIRVRPETYVTKLVGDPGCKLRMSDHRVIMDIDNRIENWFSME